MYSIHPMINNIVAAKDHTKLNLVDVKMHTERYISLALAFVLVAQNIFSQCFNAMDPGNKNVSRENHFPPIRGKGFSIFQPLYKDEIMERHSQLIAPVDEFVSTLRDQITYMSKMVNFTKRRSIMNMTPEKGFAVYLYLEMLKNFLTGSVFNEGELSVVPILGPNVLSTTKFDQEKRRGGEDWAFMGDTMTGWKRLDNVRDLLEVAIENGVKGDYIETGVWRGGSSIYARAVMDALGERDRFSYVCDSFLGLPPGEKSLDPSDSGWDKTPYLEVPAEVVAGNFIKYGLLGPNVIFAKGFFNDTMPYLSKKITELSIMRLDGDMYESTVDVLYHLYDKLSIGGFVIMDDWFGFPAKAACEDFFEVHRISPKIIPIDNLSAYWKKTEHIDIEYWRYKESKFKFNTTNPKGCNSPRRQFDAVFYTSYYQDLSSFDPEQAWRHFDLTGRIEGRIGCRDCCPGYPLRSEEEGSSTPAEIGQEEKTKSRSSNASKSIVSIDYLLKGKQLYHESASSHNPITDKVTDHTYQIMYGKFLLPYYYQNLHMKMLEIGLGCGMTYGPGASVGLHKALFPTAEIWEADFYRECVESARSRGMLDGINVLVGDQGNDTVLERFHETADRIDVNSKALEKLFVRSFI